MVYTVTLNPALDYHIELSEIKDDVQTARSTKIHYGGKGINVSYILNELNIENTAFGFIGGFSGDKLLELLNTEHIDYDFVNIQGDTRINVKIHGAEKLEINTCGPSIALRDEQELIKKLSCISKEDYLILSGSIPSSMGESAYERIISSINISDCNLVADTIGNALISLLKYKPFLIKPNNYELEEIVKRKLTTKDDIIVAGRDLQKMGARNVLVTLGKNGMILIDEQGDTNFQPIIDGKIENATGCGDSAVAGFIAGYIKKRNYSYALRLANACSNATAFSPFLATRKDIEALLLN